jgi:hypothetical protein
MCRLRVVSPDEQVRFLRMASPLPVLEYQKCLQSQADRFQEVQNLRGGPGYAPASASEEVDAYCSGTRFVGVRMTGLCAADFGCGCGTSDGSSGSIVSSNGVFMPVPLIVEECSMRASGSE